MDQNAWKNMNFNLDDMFTSQEVRENGSIERIRVDEVIPFKGHTFKVIDDLKMDELVMSISEHGIIMPTIVFYNEDNQLEMIAGHRRMRACELAGVESMPAIVKNITRDEATIIMGETNLQSREEILPSEKAFTYQVMYEAMKRQGKRSNLTSGQLGQKLTSRQILADRVNESERQIDRYMRLTKLIPELLELVDKKQMALNPAVEISYIDSINQKNIYDYYCSTCVTDIDGKEIGQGVLPSMSQAKTMRRMAAENNLDEIAIQELLDEPKPNQKSKVVLNDERVFKYKGEMTPLEFEKKIIKALEFYERYNDKIREGEREL